jgi:hypothetical protein
VITLCEAGPDAEMVAVDAAAITLPANTSASATNPPTITAPDLQG